MASLREFIATNRDRIRDLGVEKVKDGWHERPDGTLPDQLTTVIDEIVRALEREQGFPVTSPLPGKSPTFQGIRGEALAPKLNFLSLMFSALIPSHRALRHALCALRIRSGAAAGQSSTDRVSRKHQVREP